MLVGLKQKGGGGKNYRSPLKQAGSLAREQKGSLTSCREQSTGVVARQQPREKVGEREGRMDYSWKVIEDPGGGSADTELVNLHARGGI